MRKTFFITLFLTLYFAMSYAQLTVERLYTKDKVLTTEKEKAYYGKTIYYPDSAHKPIQVEELYASNNNLKLRGTVIDILANNFFGKKYEYYENGNLKSEIMLLDNLRQIDTAYYYHPNGKIKSIFYYPFTINSNEKYTISSPLYLLYADSTGKELLKDGNGFAVDESSAYSEGNYVNHKKEGQWKGHFSDKKYTFVETFKDNKIISGISTDLIGNEISYDSTTFKKDPMYPGGMEKLMKFVTNNFLYPRESQGKHITGIIEVFFEIDDTGQPKNFNILNDVGYGTAKATLSLMKKMKKWSPAIGRGVPSHIFFTLPIRLN